MGNEDDKLAEAKAQGVDVEGVGVPIDSEEADPEHRSKGKDVRRDVDGRPLHPWEVDPKDQAGPAAAQLKDEKKKR